MRRVAWMRLGAWTLALFFIVGGAINIVAPTPVVSDLLRWGYPSWFHYVTGTLELTAAVLLARQRTRRVGVLLGLAVTGGAATTLLLNGEAERAVVPLIVAALLIRLGFALHRRHNFQPRRP